MQDMERQRLALQLFAEAADVAPAERGQWIAQRCGGDEILQKQLEKLLGADAATAVLGDDRVDGFLAAQVNEIHPDVSPLEAESPEVEGSYRIIRVIGEGGMGTVYEAEQVNPRRRVAIKAIRPGAITPQMRKRFEMEAQVLGRLQHPGIARLYEADTESVGGKVRGYLAMELVDGAPIDEFVKSNRLDINGVLRLFMKVCDAVQYAHRMGVIHRDLKPANILVDKESQPRILDFGVARTIGTPDGAESMHASLTLGGQIVGTLAYMSPEQMDGHKEVDTRCDVYALGVLLYKLLTGVLPIDISKDSLPTAIKRVSEESPQPPSKVDRRLVGDLDVIVLKALEKNIDRRYSSVQTLCAELERYLDGRPIEARGDSAIYVLRKTVWRHRRYVLAGSLLAALLLAFAIYSSIQAAANRHLAVAAEDARARAQQKADELRTSLYLSSIGFAQAALATNDAARARQQLDACPPELRNWEWYYLDRQIDTSKVIARIPANSGGMDIGITNDAKYAFVLQGKTFSVYDAATGALIRSHEVDSGGPVLATAGDGWAYTVGGNARNLKCFETATGRLMWEADAQQPDLGDAIGSVAAGVAPVAVHMYTSGTVQVHDMNTGALLSQFKLPMTDIFDLRISDDGKLLYIVDGDRKVSSWNASDGAHVASYDDPKFTAHSLSLSPDGTKLIVKGYSGPTQIWDVPSHKVIRRFDSLTYSIGRTFFTPDGKQFFGACSDYAIRQWVIDDFKIPLVLRGSPDWTQSMTYFPATRTLITVDATGSIRRWESDALTWTRWVFTGQKQLNGIAAAGGDSMFLSAGEDGTIRRWQRRTLRGLKPLEGHTAAVKAIAVNDGGVLAVSGSADGAVKLWNVAEGTLNADLTAGAKQVNCVAISLDGQIIAAGDDGGDIRIWRGQSRSAAPTINTGSAVRAMQIDPFAQKLITSHDNGAIMLWDLQSGTKRREVSIGEDVALSLRLSRDGRQLAIGTQSGTVALRDPTDLREISLLGRHRRDVQGLVFSPDGRRLFSGGEDRVVRIWDTAARAEVLALREAGFTITGLDLSDDGKELFASTLDGRVTLSRCDIPSSTAATQPATTQAK